MIQHRRSAFGFVLVLFSTAWLGADHGERVAQPATSYAWVIFGSDTVRAEIARTDEERERGLMFRESVPDGTGMLFVFQQAEIQGVWMKDTYVPLDVAFLDAQSRILNIEQLEPLDLTPKWSQGPVMFALEVRQGWFADHRVSVGDRAEIVFGGRRGRTEMTSYGKCSCGLRDGRGMPTSRVRPVDLAVCFMLPSVLMNVSVSSWLVRCPAFARFDFHGLERFGSVDWSSCCSNPVR